MPGSMQPTVEMYRQQARTQARQRVHALARRGGAAAHEVGALRGRGGSRRCASSRVEQSHDCDLVVLGKHGQSATADLLLGSVTKHVLAEGSADVLVSTRRGT